VPRVDFSTTLPGLLKRANSFGTVGNITITDARQSFEDVTGIQRVKPKGWIPPLGYSLLAREYHRAYGYSDIMVTPSNWSKYSDYVGGSGGRFNSLNHFDTLCSDTLAETHLDHSKALTRARLKIKAQDVDLGVAFAERKRTAMMLGDNAKRMAKAARSLQDGSYRNAARALGIKGDPGRPRGSNWTSHWLQLQYGWKPLLSDVYGACSALSKQDRSDWRVTAKASERETSNYSYSSPDGTGPVNDFWTGAAERQRGVFVRLDAIPDNDLLISLVSLGVTNPLKVAWELVPYSFVVDWAFPVGNWLDSLDALLGYTQCYSSISKYNETRWTGKARSKTWTSTKYHKADWTEAKKSVKFTRSASSGIPLPTFPRFKDPRSLGHMANGLSLLAQAFTGRRR